ncbi:unnamed protein product [Nezara viridula]|uniref:Uncharacterized protein n=1 Tax=Nezara viridula TaxID=85310 RepID=A0A9P0GZ37_NEZVI|nr:unnamed protein product [Nezara viridula]
MRRYGKHTWLAINNATCNVPGGHSYLTDWYDYRPGADAAEHVRHLGGAADTEQAPGAAAAAPGVQAPVAGFHCFIFFLLFFFR